jgi:hypothetical protein
MEQQVRSGILGGGGGRRGKNYAKKSLDWNKKLLLLPDRSFS